MTATAILNDLDAIIREQVMLAVGAKCRQLADEMISEPQIENKLKEIVKSSAELIIARDA